MLLLLRLCVSHVKTGIDAPRGGTVLVLLVLGHRDELQLSSSRVRLRVLCELVQECIARLHAIPKTGKLHLSGVIEGRRGHGVHLVDVELRGMRLHHSQILVLILLLLLLLLSMLLLL